MNPWVQFGFEESDYESYAVCRQSAVSDAGDLQRHQGRQSANLQCNRLAYGVRPSIHLLTTQEPLDPWAARISEPPFFFA
jgi:hypothetical protein